MEAVLAGVLSWGASISLILSAHSPEVIPSPSPGTVPVRRTCPRLDQPARPSSRPDDSMGEKTRWQTRHLRKHNILRKGIGSLHGRCPHQV